MKYIFDSSTLTYFIEKLKEKFSLKTEVTEQINELEKIESSEIEPTDEMVSLWVNTSEDESTNVVARINDDTVASNTTWSSEKINASIISGGSSSSGSVDLSAYALKTELPTKTSQLTNDSNYLTEIPSEYITETELNDKGYLTEHQSLDGFATEGYVGTMISEAHEVNIVANQTFSNAYINYLTGEFVSGGTAYACEEYIEIKGGEVYKVLGVTSIVRVAYYNSSKSYLNNYIDDTPEFEFTAPTDAQYIRVHIDNTTNLGSSLQIIGTSVHIHKNKAILDSLTSDNLHSHDNKDALDTITSDMTTKWNQSIPFNDTYVSDCNAWLTNGYIKTGAGQTSNLPSECTGSDRWGILFFIAENVTQGTGTQMYFPIDGTYKGRIFTRSLTNMKSTGSSVGDWNLLATTNDIATSSVATTSLSAEETSTTETEIEERIISNLSLGVHSDGLLYIFYNENPIGNGINININNE